MKINLLLLLLLCTSCLLAQESYSVNIDGNNFEIELDRQFTYITASGDSVRFEVRKTGEALQIQQNPVVQDFNIGGDEKVFEDILIRFTYPVNFTVAKTRPAQNIQQVTMVSGNGGGIIIQEFIGLNTNHLVDFFLGGLIGSQNIETAQPASVTLSNGVALNGKIGLDDENNKVSVYSYGKEDKGILIALIGKEESDQLLSGFLDTLEVKF